MTESPQPVQVERQGLQLVGDRWAGSGDGPVVVLLHGGGQTRHSWARTARRLAADGTTAIALDARGHGDSAWDPAGDYSIDAFVADLVGFVETLDAPPALVGASLGGITALTAAGEHPGLASGLVLVDVVIQVHPAGVDRIRDFMRARPEGFGRSTRSPTPSPHTTPCASARATSTACARTCGSAPTVAGTGTGTRRSSRSATSRSGGFAASASKPPQPTSRFRR